MISTYQIKPRFQALLKPILKKLYVSGVQPNHITCAAIGLSMVLGLAFWFAGELPWIWLLLPIGFLLRMVLNALDGMLAKTYQLSSIKGEVLNEMEDMISDVFIYFPLLKYEVGYWYLIVVFLCLSLINEAAGILAKVIARKRGYEGPMGKSDRVVMLSIYCLLQFWSASVLSYSIWLFVLVNIGLLWSTYNRLNNALKNQKTNQYA